MKIPYVFLVGVVLGLSFYIHAQTTLIGSLIRNGKNQSLGNRNK